MIDQSAPEKGQSQCESDSFKRPNVYRSVTFMEPGHKPNGDHTTNVAALQVLIQKRRLHPPNAYMAYAKLKCEGDTYSHTNTP